MATKTISPLSLPERAHVSTLFLATRDYCASPMKWLWNAIPYAPFGVPL